MILRCLVIEASVGFGSKYAPGPGSGGVDYLVAPREAVTTQKASAPQNDSRKSHLVRAALRPPPKKGMLNYQLNALLYPDDNQLQRVF